jgi:hypothetical protein
VSWQSYEIIKMPGKILSEPKDESQFIGAKYFGRGRSTEINTFDTRNKLDHYSSWILSRGSISGGLLIPRPATIITGDDCNVVFLSDRKAIL